MLDLSIVISLGALVPELAVLVGGPILLVVWRRQLPGRAVAFAVAGCVLMLLSTVFTVVWGLLFPTIVTQYDVSYRTIGVAASALAGVTKICGAIAVGLLIAAIASCRRNRPAPSDLPADGAYGQPSGTASFPVPSGSTGASGEAR
ncbi:hypothetical protein [Micromonospora sp. HM5-17]|jgi:hypothetical protein|uniref:hypothetical protein n=1 Tax=Micromonospora sp. HM5-17 TaxID=2487710 RepID=UPI000F47C075|nr:hypothetical protein [Micromonospora sp. HM5-17]ROT33965.1 hypothetical protein EF879_03495 [Micromonospora sp. HM5-17]